MFQYFTIELNRFWLKRSCCRLVIFKGVYRVGIAVGLLALTACTVTESVAHLSKSTGLVSSGNIISVTRLGPRYAWHPDMSIVKAHPKLASDKVLARSQKLINAELSLKGYSLVGVSDSPDFYIGFGLAMESSMNDNDILVKAGLIAGLQTSAEQDDKQRFEKGSLFIGLFKGLNRQPSWRVLLQGYADFERSELEQKQNYQTLIARMLRPIPEVIQ